MNMLQTSPSTQARPALVGPSIFFGLMTFLAIGLWWPDEEPNKAITVIVTLIVFISTVTLLNLGARKGVIVSIGKWMFAVLLQVCTMAYFTDAIWVNGSPLRAPDGYDPFRYDWAAVQLVRAHFDFFSIPTVTINPGVVYYIAVIYRLFGTSELYVALFNALLILASLLLVLLSMQAFGEKLAKWQWMRWLLLMPDFLLHGSHGTKEILSLFCVSLGLYLAVEATRPERRNKLQTFILLFAVSTLSALVRVPVALIVLSVYIIMAIWNSRNRAAAFVLVGIIALVASTAINDLFNIVGIHFFSVQDYIFSDYSDQRQEGWSNLLSPSNPVLSLLLSPIRGVVMLIAPLPGWSGLTFDDVRNLFLNPNLESWDNWEKLLRGLSALVLIAGFPFIASTMSTRLISRDRNIGLFIFLFVFTITAVGYGTAGIIEPRYRINVEPFWMIGVGYGYVYGKWKQWLVPFVMVLCIASVIYVLPNLQ